jgi:hypothetical protein
MSKEAGLFESMALGGIAASFAVNFTHPIVRNSVVVMVDKQSKNSIVIVMLFLALL